MRGRRAVSAREDLPVLDAAVAAVQLLGDDVPVLIKIDVEGHELSVLRGGRRTLGDARLRAVLMETNQSGSRYGVSDDDLREMMTSHGFLACGYDPFLREMTDARGGAVNTIFVRDRDEANRRVRDAPKFQLINGSI